MVDSEKPNWVARRWSYAPPTWRMFEALVAERDKWLNTAAGERTPAVVEASRPNRVVLSPWVDERVQRVEVLLEPKGDGSQLTVVTRTTEELTPEEQKAIGYRVGVAFGGALRRWVHAGITA